MLIRCAFRRSNESSCWVSKNLRKILEAKGLSDFVFLFCFELRGFLQKIGCERPKAKRKKKGRKKWPVYVRFSFGASAEVNGESTSLTGLNSICYFEGGGQ